MKEQITTTTFGKRTLNIREAVAHPSVRLSVYLSMHPVRGVKLFILKINKKKYLFCDVSEFVAIQM